MSPVYKTGRLSSTHTEELQELDWVLGNPNKRYQVLATAWRPETDGELVQTTLSYGTFDTVEEAQKQIEELRNGSEKWEVNGEYIHPYFGDLNDIHYSIKDLRPPTEEELIAEFDFLSKTPFKN